MGKSAETPTTCRNLADMEGDALTLKPVLPLKKREYVYLLILLFFLAILFAFNVFAGTTITSPRYLAIDLASPPDSPQDWLIQDWPVVKYRALFRLIVRGTWSLFFAADDAWAFYLTFVSWSFLFFSLTLILFYVFLRRLDFDDRASFVGCLLFLASPPVLLAYKYPVYTREDCLAYSLVVLGLIAISLSRGFLVGVISVAAALTRETTLILPLAYFLTSSDSKSKRIFVFSLPFLALVGIRLWWGLVQGNNFESSILNFQFPFETIAFMFCVFGVLWLLAFWGLRSRRQQEAQVNAGWHMLTSTGPLIIALVLGATLLLARAREMRIAFILFPWILPFALDWLRSNTYLLRSWGSERTFWAIALSIFAGLSAIVLYFHLTNPGVMRYFLADFKNGYWLFLGTLHFSATLAILLPMLRRLTATQSV